MRTIFPFTYIYGLIDPRTGQCRYVGKTGNLKKRLHRHMLESKAVTRKGSWIVGLKKEKMKPELVVLEEVPVNNWQEQERFWIANLRFLGCNLTNGTAGGDGVDGLDPIIVARTAAKNRGRTVSFETRRRMTESQKQRWIDNPLLRDLIGDKMRGNKHSEGVVVSEATRRKRSESLKGEKCFWFGKTHSEESKRKMTLAKLRNKNRLGGEKEVCCANH